MQCPGCSSAYPSAFTSKRNDKQLPTGTAARIWEVSPHGAAPREGAPREATLRFLLSRDHFAGNPNNRIGGTVFSGDFLNKHRVSLVQKQEWPAFLFSTPGTVFPQVESEQLQEKRGKRAGG